MSFRWACITSGIRLGIDCPNTVSVKKEEFSPIWALLSLCIPHSKEKASGIHELISWHLVPQNVGAVLLQTNVVAHVPINI